MTEFVDIEEMDELRDMLDELCEIDHGLRSNEIDFIESLCNWDGCFTVPQADYLKRLYELIC